MRIVERMVCGECGPRKMKTAQLIFKPAPGKEDVTECAFCHRIRYCKCWAIRIGRDKP